MPFVSSLSVLNQQVAGVLLAYLQSIHPDINEPLVLSSTTDLDTDFHRIRSVSQNNKEKLPAAVLTRTDIKRVTGLESNNSKYKAIFNKDTDVGTAGSTKFIPIKAVYSLRIHTTTYEEAEYIIEKLTIEHNPVSKFYYNVPNIPTRLEAKFELSPPHNEIKVSSRTDKDKSGYIYTVGLNVDVYALILTQPRDSKIILKATASVYNVDNTELMVDISVTP